MVNAATQASREPAGHLTHPAYRPDIDGLRAIAVIGVVAYHAFPRQIPGGFVGVDIFFVISGFLISTIIYGSLEQNRFSFIEFYSRRIRRIFPALVVALIVVYIAGWYSFLGDEYRQLGKNIAGGAGFVANFLFWNESGYFDNAASTKPLLHLWSLGIEEQFYIVWPLLLWAAWKRKLNLLGITIATAVLSFAFSMAATYTNPVAAFYSPLARFWELLLGGALAHFTLHKRQAVVKTVRGKNPSAPVDDRKQGLLSNAQSLLGAALIGIGFSLSTGDTPFPGWWAALPTVGCVLLISAGPDAWLNRFVLSNRVLVWIGLISFPLYLWHWPLLSFPRILEGEPPSDQTRLIAVAIAVVLAWLTFMLVEKPVRSGAHRQAITVALLVSMAVVGYTGYFTYTHNGLEARGAIIMNDGDIDHMLFHGTAAKEFFPCTPLSIRKDAIFYGAAVRCLQSKADKPIDIAIVGDSHAEHLFLGLAEQLRNKNIAYYIKTTLPVIGDPEFKEIWRYVLSDANIKTVIIAAYWYPKQGMVPEGSTLEAELSKTVEALGAAGKMVYITDDVPFFSFDPRVCKYSRPFGHKNNCVEDRSVFERQHNNYYPILQNIARKHSNTKVLNTAEYFCDSKVCSMARGGKVMYRDEGHLNLIGTRYLASRIIADNPQLAAAN